jgi:hypothetical protein
LSATLLAILLNDLGTRRYTHGRDLGTLLALVVLENFGSADELSVVVRRDCAGDDR